MRYYTRKTQGDEREVYCMEEETLVLLRTAAIKLVRECRDADLLDLMCKLLTDQPVGRTVL